MYFVFGRNAKPGRWIETPLGDIPGIRWSAWRKGARLDDVPPNPLLFTLKPMNPNASDHGPHLPSFLNAAIPLFSTTLLAELRKCGVDNLDTYPVALTDPDSGSVLDHYRAVNVIGLVSAADMAKSDAIVHPGGPALIDVAFDKLVVDEAKTGSAKLFRMAESTKTILVHQSVRDYLLASGFDDLAFYSPDNVAI